ncbi:response regulator [Lachnospiraceae bacterium ZAX-1]
MWKILIVDDEAVIRESLKRFINWESIGATVCGLAENGSKALDLILSDPPDIILSDINMPMLNGVELLSFLRTHHILAEVIFVSAYTDFAYTKAAIQYGAFDYIVKPIEEDLLLHTVAKCIEKINADAEKENSLHCMTKESLENMHSLLAHCFFDYHYVLSDADFKFLCNRHIFSGNFQAMAAIGISYGSKGRNAGSDVGILTSDIMEALQQQIGKDELLLHITSDIHVLIYLSNKEARSETQHLLSKLLDSLCTLCSSHIENANFFVSTVKPYQNNFLPLSAELATTQALSEIKNVPGIYYFEKIKTSSLHCTFPYVTEGQPALLKNYSPDTVTELIQQMFLSFVRDDIIYDLDIVKLKCIEFIDSIIGELRKYQLYTYLETDSLTSKKSIHSQGTLDKIYEITKNIFFNLFSCFEKLKETGSSQLIRATLAYIHANYGTEILLADIAKKLYVSPTYLSKIFHDECHQTFSQYVLAYRIERAKEYLKTPQYKVYQIAELCGFSDVAHFSKTFKRITNSSPHKYRNQL